MTSVDLFDGWGVFAQIISMGKCSVLKTCGGHETGTVIFRGPVSYEKLRCKLFAI